MISREAFITEGADYDPDWEAIVLFQVEEGGEGLIREIPMCARNIEQIAHDFGFETAERIASVHLFSTQRSLVRTYH